MCLLIYIYIFTIDYNLYSVLDLIWFNFKLRVKKKQAKNYSANLLPHFFPLVTFWHFKIYQDIKNSQGLQSSPDYWLLTIIKIVGIKILNVKHKHSSTFHRSKQKLLHLDDNWSEESFVRNVINYGCDFENCHNTTFVQLYFFAPKHTTSNEFGTLMESTSTVKGHKIWRDFFKEIKLIRERLQIAISYNHSTNQSIGDSQRMKDDCNRYFKLSLTRGETR